MPMRLPFCSSLLKLSMFGRMLTVMEDLMSLTQFWMLLMIWCNDSTLFVWRPCTSVCCQRKMELLLIFLRYCSRGFHTIIGRASSCKIARKCNIRHTLRNLTFQGRISSTTLIMATMIHKRSVVPNPQQFSCLQKCFFKITTKLLVLSVNQSSIKYCYMSNM